MSSSIDPSVTTELPTSAEDWSKAEAIALEYLRNDRKVTEGISVLRYDGAPYLIATWWNGGDQRVLVYGDEVHPERGVAALPPWFAFLGAARLRALSVNWLDGILQSLDASRPTGPTAGARLASGESFRELFPAIAEKDGVLAYVVHHVQVAPKPVPVPGEPPPPPGGGHRPGSMIMLQRWSLQLWPATAGLDWKLEERLERPRPPISFK